MDRRSSRRFPLRLKVELTLEERDGEPIVLVSRDVSSNGVLLETTSPLPAKSAVQLDLLLRIPRPKGLTGHDRTRIRVNGHVVRSDDFEMAVQFDPGYRFVATPG